MLLNFTGELPRDVFVAVSGGVDSMAALSFLQNRPTPPKVAYFNHKTPHGDVAQAFLTDYCQQHHLSLTIGTISKPKDPRESQEEYWRNERYTFLHSLPLPVITAHNLDDMIESWIFTSLHGQSKLIPYQNKNVIRPFRPTKKSSFIEWCIRKNVPHVEDPSNQDTHYMRNLIRHTIVPQALKVNPGLHKVLFKKILAESV